jgi:hypothetical protein
MSRYVVLQFGSDAEAEAFVLAEQRDDILIGDQQELSGYRKVEDYEVLGMFQAPTQFCYCTGSKGRIHAWGKGEKYGWWVCKKCKKPADATGGPIALMRMVVGQANNLLAQFHHDASGGGTEQRVGEGMGCVRP